MPLKGASESLKSWPPLPLIVAQPLKSWPSKTFKSSRVTKVKVGRQLHAPLDHLVLLAFPVAEYIPHKV